MPYLHPPTLLVANLIIAFALVLIVLSTRVGLGAHARGMRTWLAGDVLLLGGQVCTTADALANGTPVFPELTLTSGMVIAGVGLHLFAIHRHRRPPRPRDVLWFAAAPLLGAVIGAVSLALPHIALRAMLFNAVLTTMILVTVGFNLWPERRFLGVRMMIAAQLLAIAVNLSMLFAAAQHPERAADGATFGLLFNMVMTMLTTSAFVLWLQEELRESLRHLAATDALTGVMNRHGLLPLLQREFARAGRHACPLSVALVDIDRFKAVNDQHGHAAGDAVLVEFASALKTHARTTDLVARWGGEEFLIVLPDTDATGAKTVVERLRTRGRGGAGALPVTFSAGIASTAEPGGVDALDALLARADARLYVAKVTRDTVVAEDGPRRLHAVV